MAITIDDLPFVGSPNSAEDIFANTRKLMAPIKAQKIPVTGFVIGSGLARFPDDTSRSILKIWLDAGAELGNHTWTHPDYNHIPPEAYEAEILKNDAYLHKLLDPIKINHFRAPYLHEGLNLASRHRLRSFLKEHGYQDGPVTFDDEDYLFAHVYNDALKKGDSATAERVYKEYVPYMESIVRFFEKRARAVLGRECAQILLIHASRLNARAMPDLIEMFRKRHYRFVSLKTALKDPAYRAPENYAGKSGFSWIHRWGLTKRMSVVWEPDTPAWIVKASSSQ